MTSTPLNELRESFLAAKKTSPPCAICKSASFRTVLKRDRHNLGLTLAQCQNCALLSINPRPADEWFADMYRTFYWPLYIGHRFANSDHMYKADMVGERAEEIITTVSNYLPRTTLDDALDVGCGQGGMLAAIRKMYPTARLHGVEPSQEGAEYCQKKHGIRVHNAEWDETTANSLPMEMSLVTAIHVVEHVLDPVAFLKLAASKLCPLTGRIYIEVPDVSTNRWKGNDFFHIAHVHNFTKSTLQRLCVAAGLEPIAIIDGPANIWPWASGAICKKSATLPNAELLKASRSEITEIARHVRHRAALAASPHNRVVRAFKSILRRLHASTKK